MGVPPLCKQKQKNDPKGDLELANRKGICKHLFKKLLLDLIVSDKAVSVCNSFDI